MVVMGIKDIVLAKYDEYKISSILDEKRIELRSAVKRGRCFFKEKLDPLKYHMIFTKSPKVKERLFDFLSFYLDLRELIDDLDHEDYNGYISGDYELAGKVFPGIVNPVLAVTLDAPNTMDAIVNDFADYIQTKMPSCGLAIGSGSDVVSINVSGTVIYTIYSGNGSGARSFNIDPHLENLSGFGVSKSQTINNMREYGEIVNILGVPVSKD